MNFLYLRDQITINSDEFVQAVVLGDSSKLDSFLERLHDARRLGFGEIPLLEGHLFLLERHIPLLIKRRRPLLSIRGVLERMLVRFFFLCLL